MEIAVLPPLEWHTEKRRVLDLVPYEHNPRQMTAKQAKDLEASLAKFGLVEIPAINLDNNLVAGHQRCKILIGLGRGEEMIDVRVPNRMLTPDEFQEYLVRSNKNTGDWDYDILANVFNEESLMNWGFEEAELVGRPGHSLQFMDDTSGDDDAPEPSKAEPLVVLGDIFELGGHRLMCGSATNGDDVQKLLAGDQLNLLLTDPPYNVDYVGKTSEALTIENDKMDNSAFYQFLYDFYVNCYENMVPGAPAYIFHADTEGVNFRSAFVNAGLKLSECLIWLKQTMVMGRQDYHWKHEPVLNGYKPPVEAPAPEAPAEEPFLVHEPIIYGWKEGARHPWYSDRKQTTVLQFNRPSRNDVHPTMKPVDMLEYLIGNSSAPGEVVGDFFGGSGSTLIACQKKARRARLMELSPVYVEVIIRRYMQFCAENNAVPVVRHLNGNLTGEQILRNV